MRKLAIPGLLLMLLGACGNAPAPNLSGRWRAGGDEMAIQHREPELTVRRGAQSLTYATDGSETCNVVDGYMVCSRARWDGPFLQIDSVVKAEKGDRAESERWSLARDGATLSVRRGAAIVEYLRQ